jgi:hypothetical protein
MPAGIPNGPNNSFHLRNPRRYGMGDLQWMTAGRGRSDWIYSFVLCCTVYDIIYIVVIVIVMVMAIIIIIIIIIFSQFYQDHII